MESRRIIDAASVSSAQTHITDLSCSNPSNFPSNFPNNLSSNLSSNFPNNPSNNFPSIKCNLATGVYADNLYTCIGSPKMLRKINFVVCSERSLEIHESEKSYRKRKRARLVVDLANIYGVTKRLNDKLKLCVMLVTSEQTYYLRAVNDVTTDEWHTLLLNNTHASRRLLHGRQIEHKDFPENIWDVVVTQRPKVYRKFIDTQMQNLCTKEKRAYGPKRLCFFPHAIVLLQMHTEPGDLVSSAGRDPDAQDPDNFFYFARPFISFYGCQRKYFFIKTSTFTFGTCEVVMECESVSTAKEIFQTFQNSANKNIEIQELSWQALFDEASENIDDEDDSYYNPKGKPTTGKQNTLLPVTAYCDEDVSFKKPGKGVRFKTDDRTDLQPVTNIPKEPSVDDGLVGHAIAADIKRMSIQSQTVPKKSSSGTFGGIIASIKKKFNDKTPTTAEKETGEEESKTSLPNDGQLGELRQWAENRSSQNEDETEDSGGTLKFEDPYQPKPKPKIVQPPPLLATSSVSSKSKLPQAITKEMVEKQRTLRRDVLLTKAIEEYQQKNKQPGNLVETIELSFHRQNDGSAGFNSTESSSCGHSLNGSELDAVNQRSGEKETRLDGNSSSVLDSCISNVSEDFSGSSSSSNVEYTWRPVVDLVKSKKFSLDSRSCAGRYATLQTQTQEDANSDFSVDSCYSSLTNNGYRQIPKSQSLNQIVFEPSTRDPKKPSPIKLDRTRNFEIKTKQKCLAEPIEEPVKLSLKPNKSSSDLMSDAQQNALRSKIIKIDDQESMDAAMRQRAASLGNKAWTGTPFGQSIKRRKHRPDCKKRKINSSGNNSVLSEEQPLLGDVRNSSISSHESHFTTASIAKARIVQALLRNAPRRSNTEDLVDISLLNKPENSPLLTETLNENNNLQRETIRAFVDTNRSLIPTTRYSGDNSSAHKPKRSRRNRRGLEMDVVKCFLDLKDFEMNAKKPQQSTASNSSHESNDDVPRCRHGKPKRHHDHSRSNNLQDLNERKHSCRRHRSCQDAIVEEDSQQTESTQTKETAVVFPSESKLSSEKLVESTQQILNSKESSQNSKDQTEITMNLINNNPSPVSILA